MFALDTFSPAQGHVSITTALADIATGGTLYRAPYSCSRPCEVPYRVAQPYHLPRIESIHVTISRSLKDLGFIPDTYLGMCSEAKVYRSVASLSTAITRQTFGFFVANSSTTHTHSCHMRICERATDSSIRMEGLVLLKYVASIIGQVPTSRIGGLHMHTTEPVGIIASRRSRRAYH